MATKYLYKRDSSRLYIALGDKNKVFKIYLSADSYPIINGEEYPIKMIDNCFSDYCFLLNGKRYTCIVKNKNQNSYSILVNGVEYSFSIESLSSYLRRKILNKDSNKTVNNILTAPMPGKIIDIFVSEGDLVNADEPLLTIEAMKMQNELSLPLNGIVRKINVVSGQTVLKDEVLLELESIDE